MHTLTHTLTKAGAQKETKGLAGNQSAISA